MNDPGLLDPGRLRAVTFDLDFTLWDLSQVIVRAEELTHGFLAEHYPEAARRYTVEQVRELRSRLAEQRPELRHNVTELRRAALAQVARDSGYGDSLVEEAFRVFLDARHDVVLYDDVRPTLEALRGRFVLGAVTNGNADLRRVGLGAYFDFSLSAVEVGAAKPSHLIFEAACSRAGVDPAAMAHVGDEVESDVVGAAGHGMVPVWLNRTGAPWPATVEPLSHVELPDLASLRRRLAP